MKTLILCSLLALTTFSTFANDLFDELGEFLVYTDESLEKKEVIGFGNVLFVPSIDPYRGTLAIFSQQQGFRCSIIPRCPDCDGGGNVCRGAEEFFPGATVLLRAKGVVVSKCKNANALDYCGGSYQCMRRYTREQRDRHKSNFFGGCFAQCKEQNVRCVLDNR